MPAKLIGTEGVVDTIHGTTVADPYRWLEERHSPETEGWLAGQRARFEDYFQRLGALEVLRSRVREFVDVETTDQIGKVRDRYFYRKRKVGEQQPSIYVMNSRTHTETVLIDARSLGTYAHVGIFRISEDGNLLAYELKHGGEHSRAIHVIDLRTGRIFPDHLECGLSRGFAFRDAGDGFYYCHDFLDDDPFNPDKDHLIRFHRFGTSPQDDSVLLRFSRTPSSKLVLRADGEMLTAVLYHEGSGQLVADLHVTSQAHHDSWSCIARNIVAPFSPFFCRGMLLASWRKNSPNGEIVELDAADCHPVRVIVPEWDVPIKRLTIAQSHIYVGYLVGTEAVIRIWSLDGEFLGSLPLEGDRTWDVLPTYTNESDELFLSSESFSRPPTLFCFKTGTGEREVWGEHHAPSLKSPITARKLKYLSKDGTEIFMTLVGSVDASPLIDRPVIMTAYGGFGITLTPQFSIFVSVMLELGFLFALPEIRGGEERGRVWHLAARGRSRQAAIDDFIAGAEWLSAEGITRPEKFAIFGGSNSGLLVEAAVTQRPDLFRAVVCIAPLLDMVRYHLFDRARVWAEEYGTADDPDDFRALHAYSPYHNVCEDKNYPAVLFVSGDKDSRCNPAHARKMTARLQDRPGQTSTILLDHSSQRGHAPTMPLAVRIDALTNRIAFLCHELGVANHEEPCPVGLVSLALSCLLRTEWHLRWHGDRPLQGALEAFRRPKEGPARYSAQQICHAINVACVLYFKTVMCLQRSVALTMLLRRYGLAAELVIGARILPAKFHAWVEIKSIVVGDKPYVPQLYRELERC
jgi:prolyl oligopeptidase